MAIAEKCSENSTINISETHLSGSPTAVSPHVIRVVPHSQAVIVRLCLGLDKAVRQGYIVITSHVTRVSITLRLDLQALPWQFAIPGRTRLAGRHGNDSIEAPYGQRLPMLSALADTLAPNI